MERERREAADPELAALLGALDGATRMWRGQLGRVGQDALVWQPHAGGHSIGAVMLHIAEAEVYWLHETLGGRPMTAEQAATLMSAQIDQMAGHWPTPPRRPMEWYLAQLDAVRAATHEIVAAIASADLTVPADGAELTALRILNHVVQHEAYHGGQLALLREVRRRRPRPEPLPPVRCSAYIEAAPDAVWAAIATGAGWDAWFTNGSVVEARAGGELLLCWTAWGPDRDDYRERGQVLEAEPDRRLVFRWQPDLKPTTVTLEILPRGAGSVVSVRDDGFVTPGALADCASGWGEALALLKDWLEHGVRRQPAPPA